MSISFNSLLGNLDEQLRQQLKEYKYTPEFNPDAPVNTKPKRKRVKKDPLAMKKTDRSAVKASAIPGIQTK